MELKSIGTKELVEEIKVRSGTRSIEINKNEIYKVQAIGNDGSRNRYIKGKGAVVILEVII
ncbi:hypothetical protein [Clostridium gasigenes]|uniref:hypothetical protein n=1 Tax=Clostridium gasigenes TaxID=94869 RepID=UPI001C0C256E|nr:hypothetical protein [Clostridium gasigenes]MBU3109347.1 hypothetical protein [Clostridium gasigenes]